MAKKARERAQRHPPLYACVLERRQMAARELPTRAASMWGRREIIGEASRGIDRSSAISLTSPTAPPRPPPAGHESGHHCGHQPLEKQSEDTGVALHGTPGQW